MMVLGPGHLVHALLQSALVILLVVPVAEDHFHAQNLEFLS